MTAMRKNEIKHLHLGTAARAVTESLYEKLHSIESDLLARINKALKRIDAKPLEGVILTLRNGREYESSECLNIDDKEGVLCPRGVYNPSSASLVLYCEAKIGDLSHLIIYHLQNTSHKSVVIDHKLAQVLKDRMHHWLNPSEIESISGTKRIEKLLKEEGG